MEQSLEGDFSNDNLLVKGYERYSTFWIDPRAVWPTGMEMVSTLPMPSILVSLPMASAIGIAAVIIKNPTVTRRFFDLLNSRLRRPSS